jgi:hypothetical protein
MPNLPTVFLVMFAPLIRARGPVLFSLPDLKAGIHAFHLDTGLRHQSVESFADLV